MTKKEIINGLKFTIDMFKFDPSTGEEAYLNEDDMLTVNACEAAIQVMEKLDSLKSQIAFAKLNIKSQNSDYLMGYRCALSAVEGMIAEMEFDK